ncbi:hypothetical protein BGZ83_004658, partial [Gryganskiella cystojenkinii]
SAAFRGAITACLTTSGDDPDSISDVSSSADATSERETSQAQTRRSVTPVQQDDSSMDVDTTNQPGSLLRAQQASLATQKAQAVKPPSKNVAPNPFADNADVAQMKKMLYNLYGLINDFCLLDTDKLVFDEWNQRKNKYGYMLWRYNQLTLRIQECTDIFFGFPPLPEFPYYLDQQQPKSTTSTSYLQFQPIFKKSKRNIERRKQHAKGLKWKDSKSPVDKPR